MTPYPTLIAAATEWLRYERGCYLVMWERGPWERAGHKPDVFGVNAQKKTIEIEIKRSLADFKNDAEKNIWQQRELFKRAWPHQFYYLVPPELVHKVRPLVRDGFGLLTLDRRTTYGGNPGIIADKRAAMQKDARELTLRQMAEMARHQSGTLVSLATALATRGIAANESNHAPEYHI